jgi:hypothetical protein
MFRFKKELDLETFPLICRPGISTFIMSNSGLNDLTNNLHATLSSALTGLDTPGDFDLNHLPDLTSLDDESLMELRYHIFNNATDYSTPEFIQAIQSIDQELAVRRDRDTNDLLKSKLTPEEDQQTISDLLALLHIFGNVTEHDVQILEHCPLIMHAIGVWRDNSNYPAHLKIAIHKLRDSMDVGMRYLAEILDVNGQPKPLTKSEQATLHHFLEEALQDIDFDSRDVATIAMYEQRLERHYFGQ